MLFSLWVRTLTRPGVEAILCDYLMNIRHFAWACTILGATAAGIACGDTQTTPLADGGGGVDGCSGNGCTDAPTPTEEDAQTDGGQSKTDADAKIDPVDAWQWQPPVLPTTSAGCGIPKGALKNVTHTTPSGRTFHVWGPNNYDPNTNYPVALTYSGWYTNGPAFQSWFSMDQQVGNDGLTVFPDSDGPEWDQFGMKDINFFDEMMKVLADNYCINPSRVLGFGFSNGGIFMSHLGCLRAGYVKAISVGDGSKGGPGNACGRLPVLITHRTKDPDELIAWGYENRDRWAGFNGCSLQSTPGNQTFNCTTQNNCKSPGSVMFCEDTWFDPGWPNEWNHTVRPEYRQFTWDWFKALP